MSQVMIKPWVKWALPLAALALVAALVTGGLALTGGGGALADDGWEDAGFTDINPAYSSVVAIPGEVLPPVLYSIEVDPESDVVEIGAGIFGTVVVENLIEEPLVNNGVTITRNGDLVANITVTAEVYNVYDPSGCLVAFNPGTSGIGVPEQPLGNPVIRWNNVTIHPGRTVTLMFPIAPGINAIPSASFLLKAEVLPGMLGP